MARPSLREAPGLSSHDFFLSRRGIMKNNPIAKAKNRANHSIGGTAD
jgi:hypothetical protein